MLTKPKLYLAKPDVYDHDVRLTSVDLTRVVADPEVFYPRGGGQPADCGCIIFGDGTSYDVVDVQKSGVLELDRPAAFGPGSMVHAKVDRAIRERHESLHTGLHVLNAIVYHRFAARVTGAEIRSDGTARMDFNLPDVSNSEVRELQGDLTRIIAEDRPVLQYYLPRGEAMKLPGAVRTENRDIPPGDIVRVVEIQGLDLQCCGGTHKERTGEVGDLRITKVENKGRGNRRVEVRLFSSGALSRSET